jgi:DNA-binding PadR family transcriptional regulator
LCQVTKIEILAIFAAKGDFIAPDDIRDQLRLKPDRRSLYSYLLRLARQGLLERGANRRKGHLTYRLTQRGVDHLDYLGQHPR